MAAGRKEYELQMKLSAALGSNFNSSFQAAMSTAKKLQNTLSRLKGVQGDISAYKKTQEALSASKAKVQEYEAKHNALQSELAQTVTKEKELQKALKQSEKTAGEDSEEYKNLQKQLQNTRNEKSKLNSQIKDNERATARENEKIKEQEQKLSELSTELQTAGINTGKLTQENEKLEKAYQRVQKAQEDYARVNTAIEKNKSAISATKNELLKTVGVASAAGAAFYKGFITPAANLQEQMSTVKAISGATAEEMEQLNALAKKMGATTKFTAVEAGQALEYMAMAGWKTQQMINGLPGIMNLAVASGEELATVSDIVTDAMTAFGLAADGTTKGISNVNYFTDILAATAANSNTNVALLGESFKYAAPLAGAFNFSVEDTALMLGLMANSGIKASQSGTSLRKIFTALSGNLEIAQKDGSKFVVATQNADGSMRGLKEIIDDVRVAFGGMSESDIIAMQNDLAATAQSLGIDLNDENGELKTQAALYADVQDAMQGLTDAGKVQEAEAIASKTAMAGLLSIVNTSGDDYNKLAEAIYNANGAAEKMAQTRLDNLNGDITLAKSAWDGLATTIGEMFLPNLRTAVQKVTEFLNKANEFAQANPGLIKQIAGVAAGLAGLKIGSLAGKLGLLQMNGGILEAVKSFLGLKANIAESAASALTGGKSIKTLGTIFGGIGGKILPIIAIISALSILFLKLSGEDTSEFIAPFKDALEQLKPVLASSMEQFKKLGNDMLPLVVDAAKKLAPILGQIVTAILPVVISLIESLVPLIDNLVRELLPVILDIITTLAPLISDIITAILPVVISLLDILLPIITQLVKDILPLVAMLIEPILSILSELIHAILPILTGILQALMPIIQAVAEMFGYTLGAALDGIQPIIRSVMGYFEGLIDFITGVFTGDWEKAWGGVVNVFKNIIDGLVAIFKIPINFIIDGINFFLSGLNNIKIPDWVPGVGGMGINIQPLKHFEKGSNYTPDTFIAGDVNGKGGELVTGARGRKVFTAAQTTAIFDNIKMAKAINDSAEQNAPRPATMIERVGGFIGIIKNTAAERLGGEAEKLGISEIPTSGGGTKFEIYYNPTIYVEGDKPGDLEEKLKQNNAKLLQMFKEFLRQQREDERRMNFA